MNVPHPIPYQGSKRALAATILTYCPSRVPRLVEPFAGSAAISLAAATRRQACSFLINDAHRPLVELWRKIVDEPEQLSARYRELWEAQAGQERDYYDRVREEFNRTHEPALFLYLLARCVKAAIRYNSRGEFNNSPDNRRKGARPDTMRNRIIGAASLLQGRTTIEHLDYTEVLDNCSTTDLIYMDPPYQGVCQRRDTRYAPTIDHEQFCEALAKLNERQMMFIVSYDGRTGEKTYGQMLPEDLDLTHIEVEVGRSTQATLLGRQCITYESLYLSPAVARILRKRPSSVQAKNRDGQLQFAS